MFWCIHLYHESTCLFSFKTTTVGEFIRPGNRDQCFFRESSAEAAAKVTGMHALLIISHCVLQELQALVLMMTLEKVIPYKVVRQ